MLINVSQNIFVKTQFIVHRLFTKSVYALTIADKQESKEANGRILALILEAEDLPLRGKGKIQTYAKVVGEFMTAPD